MFRHLNARNTTNSRHFQNIQNRSYQEDYEDPSSDSGDVELIPETQARHSTPKFLIKLNPPLAQTEDTPMPVASIANRKEQIANSAKDVDQYGDKTMILAMALFYQRSLHTLTPCTK
jgi:hypothetical protein